MRAANALDFDDLLVFGLRLFTEVPEVLRSCKHILVDEFQVSYLLTIVHRSLMPRTRTPHNTSS